MNKSIVMLAVVICGGLYLSAPSFAAQTYLRDDGKQITAQQKQASDQDMQTGLSQLEAASTALQSGSKATALTDLRQAFASMYSAEPIYHGYREKALILTRKAGLTLDKGGSGASSDISEAISDAQTAVSSW
jgi:hypothetical protein